jgi:glycosyltransferase involved in cell wall biosynthesis
MRLISTIVNVCGSDDDFFFSKCLESVSNQTVASLEVIISVDGEISEGLELVISQFKEHAKSPVIVLRSPTSQGLWAARNRAIETAAGEWLLVQDADDISHPQRTEILQSWPIEKNTAVIGTSMIEFRSETERVISVRTVPLTAAAIARQIRINSPINHPTVLLRRSALLKVGLYRNIYLMEDYDLWLRLMDSRFGLLNLDLPLVAFRLGEGLYFRRGGTRFLKAELQMGLRLWRSNHLNFVMLLRFLIIRILYRLLPSFARKFAHHRFLSRNVASTQYEDLSVYLEQDFRHSTSS